jgi:murein DD-endopeptidase MepM/ murein hydrolase activator NlpD
VGRKAIPALRPGRAVIRVTASRARTWLRRPEAVVAELDLPVRLVPPSLAVLSTQNYAAQGGAGVVVYRVGDSSVKDGVEVGGWWFPGAPLPGAAPGDRFAVYGVPYDLEDGAALHLSAVDDVGNRAQVAFVDRFFRKPFKKDTIPVTDAFMSKVVPEILSRTPELGDKGSLLGNYLEINRRLRTRNAAELVRLGERSAARFLWTESFLPMPNAKVMSAFADRRTYLHDGAEIDRQDHLGFDLAVTRQAPVPASNDGVVLLARYLGIYGNAVVIDHGYGVQSLYGHLSSIDVSEGAAVKRGEIIGRTGQTGLAGGDHLHFTVLVRGLPVNPVEWWDAHWIRDRVASKLPGVLH